MRKYNLGIANIGKTLLITGLTIITGPLIFFAITKHDPKFPEANTFISILIFIIPFVIFIIWLLNQKYKDVFKVTSDGIESENHEIIKWQDIDHCSWESIRGSISVYLKLKNKKRLSIGVSTWKDYSKGYNELQAFFNEIQKAQEILTEKDKFQIYNERISCILTVAFIVLMLGLLIVMIVFNVINK